MFCSSSTAYLEPPSGELLVGVAIAGLPADQARRFAELCSERLASLKTGPTAAACEEEVSRRLEWDGWDRASAPAGLFEAQELGWFAFLLPSYSVTPEGFVALATTDVGGAEALAAECAWCWSTLADLAGFAGMDGVVIGAMAETWSLDFMSLLLAVRAATA